MNQIAVPCSEPTRPPAAPRRHYVRGLPAHPRSASESPCFPHPKSPHGATRAAPGLIVDKSIRLNAEQVAQARKWLVHILAQRAVEIVKAEEGKI